MFEVRGSILREITGTMSFTVIIFLNLNIHGIFFYYTYVAYAKKKGYLEVNIS